MMMRTLLVAPSAGLPNQAPEVRAVSLSLSAAPLTGVVTHADLTTAIMSQRWDCIWFAAHGSTAGVELSDGILGSADLIQLMRNSGAQLLFLNTCDSEVTGLYLHHQLGIDVICTIGPVDDATAATTAALLASNLAAGMTVADAYQRSVPGDVLGAQRWRLFHNGDHDDSADMRIMQMLTLMFDRVDQRISQVETDLSKEIGALRDSMDDLARNMRDQFHPRLSRRHGQMWLFGAILAGIGPLLTLPALDNLLDLSIASQIMLVGLCEMGAMFALVRALQFDWRR